MLTQQTQARVQANAPKVAPREQLDKAFIEEAARLYADTLVHPMTDVSKVVWLYAMISEMRVLSARDTVESADEVARLIVNTYRSPRKTIPAVNRTSPTYGAFTILTYHLNQHLDLNGRGEWFWDKDGARTGNVAHYGEVAVGLNIMPNRWINFRPELRGDFASDPAFGSVSSSQRERSQFTAAFDVTLKFH